MEQVKVEVVELVAGNPALLTQLVLDDSHPDMNSMVHPQSSPYDLQCHTAALCFALHKFRTVMLLDNNREVAPKKRRN
jgi:hypothetical protein